ncbi:tRNA 5-hydroxyuridine modification protein YegQ [Gilliamella sp. ESL0232]|uniref:prephenate-dependent tRNA uridine(34) hydroxylase TrhP n=1 Tax=unclassified Gilliamella TaxID=2685620 RepID=UPI00080EA204|nr:MULTISPECIES: tRNA 5-hydroxyuridine modification protein YegQ [Gilliamella]MCO6555952.1 tRNA 5-hydroxyuridine modification protein YegQ [Gilliamella sp.]MCO6560210.1 tRNA 5-hydroxyuridine modification protein YegQ [Gilliamella sp.]NUE95366.1 tRNA 5-hydroxyuridine modification protein YegQ [Gilliamella sp. ESL0232]OCG77436.1 U32 family peptidase [Gilliamella apicola]
MTNLYAKPELLSPAGSLKNMRYAFAYGADAVYAGQPRYSLRVRNNEFNHENLAIGINEAHAQGKKFYVVVNIAPHNSKLKTFIRDLEPIVNMKPDAFIMSDPGLIMLVREHFPDMEIHLSVQSNAVNWATVKFWHKMGLTRVVLSRELSLDEIAEIREKVPEMELEVFIHGALCMAYSGRCLLSGYINKRDSNQGTCTNACRWKYKVAEGKEDEVGQIVHKCEPISVKQVEPTLGIGQTTSKVFMLEESGRPGEYMQAYEDEHGTYIMNSKDLRAVELVDDLTKIGVHSLKIEGRTKSFYYCARTAQVYRQAIDAASEGKPFDPRLLQELNALAHRGYTEGFLRRHKHEEMQNYEHSHSVSERQQFVGEFSGERLNGLAEVIVKNKFSVGDSVEMMTPKGNKTFTIERMENKKGQPVPAGLGDGHIVYIPIPEEIDLNYALLMRNFD